MEVNCYIFQRSWNAYSKTKKINRKITNSCTQVVISGRPKQSRKIPKTGQPGFQYWITVRLFDN